MNFQFDAQLEKNILVFSVSLFNRFTYVFMSEIGLLLEMLNLFLFGFGIGIVIELHH